MTEQLEGSRHEEPDTAALRASLDAGYGVELDTDEIYALLDALDAARAERDQLATEYRELQDKHRAATRRAEAAEARIAAALAQIARTGMFDIAAVRRALTGDTTPALNRSKTDWIDTAEAAEARIAAALDLCATTPTSPCDPHCRVIDIRRALTEGTGQ